MPQGISHPPSSQESLAATTRVAARGQSSLVDQIAAFAIKKHSFRHQATREPWKTHTFFIQGASISLRPSSFKVPKTAWNPTLAYVCVSISVHHSTRSIRAHSQGQAQNKSSLVTSWPSMFSSSPPASPRGSHSRAVSDLLCKHPKRLTHTGRQPFLQKLPRRRP